MGDPNGVNTATEVKTENGAEKKNATYNLDTLEGKIVRQVEHYFGDYNLPRDKFLKETIKSDDGWVSMEIMLKFQRLSSLSQDAKVSNIDPTAMYRTTNFRYANHYFITLKQKAGKTGL